MTELIKLRHKLHSIPELSGYEVQTSNLIYEFVKSLNPDTLLNDVGGHGIIAVFDSSKPGNTVLFRADMDALPIIEPNQLPYTSIHNNVSHKCGHDGHSAMLCGFAQYCSLNRPAQGKIVLLFQPAEETGNGALNVLNDSKFAAFKPNYSFALHNLPGYPINSIVIREKTFAAASKGIIIKLFGVNSHASEPEKGISPCEVFSDLIRRLPTLTNNNQEEDDFSLITIVHANMGVPAFGTSPADAIIMLTLRAYSNQAMDQISRQITDIADHLATAQQLKYSIEYADEFPATINHKEAVNIVRDAAKGSKFETVELKYPFRWSEDFAHFTVLNNGALFGIGSGVDHLPLHNPHYDFPDAIIVTGVEMWKALYQKLCF